MAKTYYHIIYPDREGRGVLAAKPDCKGSLMHALALARKGLPIGTYIYWGATRHENEKAKAYQGFLLEVIYKHLVCLYAVDGYEKVLIRTKEVGRYFH